MSSRALRDEATIPEAIEQLLLKRVLPPIVGGFRTEAWRRRA